MTCHLSDIIVLGGGITGCSLAYELKKKSYSVTVLEQSSVGNAASGRNGGGVRQQNRVPEELPLAMVAVKVWQDLARQIPVDMEYRQHGNLMVILSRDRVDHFKQTVERERKAGLVAEFLDEKQVREQIPVLSSDVEIYGGTYCPSDGSANPLLATRAVAAKARQMGADIRENEPVIDICAGRTVRVKTTSGFYESPIIINAAGVGAGALCDMLGFHLPCQVKRSQIIVTKATAPVIKPFITYDGGYMRQVLNGNFHMGVNSKPVRHQDIRTGINVFTDVARQYLSFFPFMEHLPVLRTWAGLTYWTPDAFPVIGLAPGYDNVYLATGFSGHGFCLGPGAARVLTQVIAGEEPEANLDCFSWSRFSTTNNSETIY